MAVMMLNKPNKTLPDALSHAWHGLNTGFRHFCTRLSSTNHAERIEDVKAEPKTIAEDHC